VPVTVNLAQIIKDNFGKLSRFENGSPSTPRTASRRGRRHDRQQDLANTLRLIQAQAPTRSTRETSPPRHRREQKARGILTLEDLAAYQVKVRKPITGRTALHARHRTAASGGRTSSVAEHPRTRQRGRARRTEPGRGARLGRACKLVFADRSKYSRIRTS